MAREAQDPETAAAVRTTDREAHQAARAAQDPETAAAGRTTNREAHRAIRARRPPAQVDAERQANTDARRAARTRRAAEGELPEEEEDEGGRGVDHGEDGVWLSDPWASQKRYQDVFATTVMSDLFPVAEPRPAVLSSEAERRVAAEIRNRGPDLEKVRRAMTGFLGTSRDGFSGRAERSTCGCCGTRDPAKVYVTWERRRLWTSTSGTNHDGDNLLERVRLSPTATAEHLAMGERTVGTVPLSNLLPHFVDGLPTRGHDDDRPAILNLYADAIFCSKCRTTFANGATRCANAACRQRRKQDWAFDACADCDAALRAGRPGGRFSLHEGVVLGDPAYLGLPPLSFLERQVLSPSRVYEVLLKIHQRSSLALYSHVCVFGSESIAEAERLRPGLELFRVDDHIRVFLCDEDGRGERRRSEFFASPCLRLEAASILPWLELRLALRSHAREFPDSAFVSPSVRRHLEAGAGTEGTGDVVHPPTEEEVREVLEGVKARLNERAEVLTDAAARRVEAAAAAKQDDVARVRTRATDRAGAEVGETGKADSVSLLFAHEEGTGAAARDRMLQGLMEHCHTTGEGRDAGAGDTGRGTPGSGAAPAGGAGPEGPDAGSPAVRPGGPAAGSCGHGRACGCAGGHGGCAGSAEEEAVEEPDLPAGMTEGDLTDAAEPGDAQAGDPEPGGGDEPNARAAGAGREIPLRRGDIIGEFGEDLPALFGAFWPLAPLGVDEVLARPGGNGAYSLGAAARRYLLVHSQGALGSDKVLLALLGNLTQRHSALYAVKAAVRGGREATQVAQDLFAREEFGQILQMARENPSSDVAKRVVAMLAPMFRRPLASVQYTDAARRRVVAYAGAIWRRCGQPNLFWTLSPMDTAIPGAAAGALPLDWHLARHDQKTTVEVRRAWRAKGHVEAVAVKVMEAMKNGKDVLEVPVRLQDGKEHVAVFDVSRRRGDLSRQAGQNPTIYAGAVMGQLEAVLANIAGHRLSRDTKASAVGERLALGRTVAFLGVVEVQKRGESAGAPRPGHAAGPPPVRPAGRRGRRTPRPRSRFPVPRWARPPSD